MYFCDNKMELGFMKNETCEKEISDACAIRAKMYAFRMSDGSEEKKVKGVRGYVVKDGLIFDARLRQLHEGSGKKAHGGNERTSEIPSEYVL